MPAQAPAPPTVPRALRVLRDAIVAGQLAQGAQLREHHLAASLDLGRSAVREALRQLVQEGLVEHRPHRGAFVLVVDAAAAADLLVAREAIELGVVQRILAAGAPPQLGDLELAWAELHEAATADDQPSDRLIRAHVDFHRRLVALAGSARLGAAYETLAGQGLMLLRHHPPRPGWDYAASHRSVLDGLRALDPATPDLLRAHLRATAPARGTDEPAG